MRRVADDFKNDLGQAELHFGVLHADRWRRHGLPQVPPIDRMVWAFLRSCDCHRRRTVSEVAQKVWGDGDHRKTARAALRRLEDAGLAIENDEGWSALLPAKPKEAPKEGGRVDPPTRVGSSTWGDQPTPGAIDPGAIDPGAINPPMGRSTQEGWGDQPTLVGRSTHPIDREIGIDSNDDARECVREGPNEQLDDAAVVAPPPHNLDDGLPNYRAFWDAELGDLDLLALLRHYSTFFRFPDLKPPKPSDLVAWSLYLDVAIEAELLVSRLRYRAKGAEIESPGGLRATIEGKLAGNPVKAQRAILDALDVVERAKKKSKAATAQAQRQEAQAAEVKRRAAPQLPEWDEEQDGAPAPRDTDAAMAEHRSWVRRRVADFDARLAALEAASDDHEDLRLKAEEAFRHFVGQWDRACRARVPGAKPDARRQLLGRLALIVSQFEERKDALEVTR